MHSVGHVGVTGRANVGKSTLINALLGRDVSIVTHKANTTRHRILGVQTQAHAQVVWIDTPGLNQRIRHKLNHALNRAAWRAWSLSDVLLWVMDADAAWTGEDQWILERIQATAQPIVVALNKVDRLPSADEVLPLIAQRKDIVKAAAWVPVSAKKHWRLDVLWQAVVEHLPQRADWLYPPDQVDVQPPAFHMAEMIREQVFVWMHDELPYETHVEVDRWQDHRTSWQVSATIWVARDSQKSMIIGAGGRGITKIRKGASRAITMRLARKPVRLQLGVRVRKAWSRSQDALHTMGYGQ